MLKKPFAILVLLAAAVMACHLSTVKCYPLCWLDEVDIIETGRFSVFDTPPDWSVNLIQSKDGTLTPPPPFFHYAGGAFLEFFYRMTGSYVASRTVAMFGLFFMVLLFYRYLRQKGFSPWLSFIPAALMLADTNLSVGVHWYRVDMWVFCLTLSALLLILNTRGRSTRHQCVSLFLVGCLMVFEVCFWITAVIHWILILAEVLALAQDEKWKVSRYISGATSGVLGAVSMFAVCLIPIAPSIGETFAQYTGRLGIGSGLQYVAQVRDWTALLHEGADRTILFVKLLCRTPFVWIGVLIGCTTLRRNPFHFLALLLGCCVVVSTSVYHNRVNYLTPTAFFFFACGLRVVVEQKHRLVRLLLYLFLAGAFAFAYGLSVIGMNYFARPINAGNTFDILTQKFESVIGSGPKRVYILSYEPYHSGRKLGWKLFAHLPFYPNALFNPAEFGNVTEQTDYIIACDDNPLSEQQKQFLRAKGFTDEVRIEMPIDVATGLTKRIRPLTYARGYPSFSVWRKP